MVFLHIQEWDMNRHLLLTYLARKSACFIPEQSIMPYELIGESLILVQFNFLTVWLFVFHFFSYEAICIFKTHFWYLKGAFIGEVHHCLLRNMYVGQEATVRIRHGTTDWLKIGKGVCQSCILSPCLFNSMQTTSGKTLGWMNHKLKSRLLGEISITSDMQITPCLW